MNCPRCKTSPLITHQDANTRVVFDVCPACKGIFFDAGEIEAVLDVAAKDLRPPARSDHAPTALCPKCYTPMTAFEYPQTLAVIDLCPACHALWLDGGEFKEIAAVRRALKAKDRLDPYAPVPGVKGKLIRFINAAIDRLTQIDFD